MERKDGCIFLCGFMGAGKTTVGRALAKRLGWRFLDTDAIIEERFGPIPQIFAEQGEARFREMEAQIAAELREQKKAVISTGGGFILSQAVQKALAGSRVVYLTVTFEECYRRISASDRPLVKKNTVEQLRELYCARDTVYRAHSVWIAKNEDSLDKTVAALAEWCQGRV